MWRKLQYYREYLYQTYPPALRRIENPLLRKAALAFVMPICFVRHARFFLPGYLALKYLDIPITTRCSLRCANCSNLMQHYKKPEHIETGFLLKSIRSLFRHVDHVVQLNILGGEPFLHKDLPKVLELILEIDKIQRVVVITNGTIVPKDARLIELLSHRKVQVYISDYGPLSRRKDELRAMFAERGIAFEVETPEWEDFGDFSDRGRTAEQLKQQFALCNTPCKTVFKGKFYVCPRSAHGMDLGLIPLAEEDCVDLMDPNLGREAIRQAIRRLDIHTEYLAFCNHCDRATPLVKQAVPGEQVAPAVEEGLEPLLAANEVTG